MKKTHARLNFAVLTLLCVVCAPAFGADGLVLHMSLDQGAISNGVATDLSGQGNDGLVTGDPQVVEGVLGNALVFDGTDDVIEVLLQPSITFEQGDSFSVMAWVKTSVHPSLNDGIVGNYRTSTAEFWALLANDAAGGMTLFLRDVGRVHVSRLDSPDPINTDTWIHVAGVRDQQKKEAYLYIDGEVVASMPDETENINSGQSIWIGDHLNRFYDGLMDDVRIYNSALDQAAIQQAMKGTTELASAPNPKNEAADVLRDVTLAWEPGEFAAKHNVYLGAYFDDVNNAGTDSDLLVSQGQTITSYNAGSLDFGQTYYWRVDEVNSAPDNTVYKGDVWSFTAERLSIPVTNVTATASSSFGASGPERTINGSGLVDDLHGVSAADMWISAGIPATIEYAFDKVYKLHELWIWNSNQLIEAFVGFGAKDVVIEHSLDGENWSVLEGVGPLAQAPGTEGYAHNNTIDFGVAVAQHVRVTVNSVHGIAPQASLSEVRFFFIPTYATGPNPATDATNVAPDTTLSWGRSGREADRHEIYVGTHANDLALEGADSESSFSTHALDLQLGTRYTWRVDEVNEAMDPSVWTGDLWSFTTADTITVDDMESYRDEEFLEIWATWIDGFDDPGNNGAVVGAVPSLGDFSPESTIVNGGSQSLPIHFDNSGAPRSEATRTFAASQDWSKHGVQGLVLSFHGSVDNTGGRLYVKVNDTQVVYDGDPADLQLIGWHKWTIDLGELPAATRDAVRSLTIGIDGGGSGVVYIDEIFLTP